MSTREEVLIIAHRGASADYPENTREAFVGAAEQGADWAELDVRLSVDGALIVHHDAWYLDERNVWKTPARERPEGVLELVDALEACRAGPSPLGVNVEIKNVVGDLGGDDVPHTLDVVDVVLDLLDTRAAAGIEEEILISSFDAASIDRVRSLDGPPTGQLVFDLVAWPDVVASTADRGHVALHPWDPFVDAPLVESAHRAGLAVNTWTVDEFDRIRHLADLGVDGIVTNTPRSARHALTG